MEATHRTVSDEELAEERRNVLTDIEIEIRENCARYLADLIDYDEWTANQRRLWNASELHGFTKALLVRLSPDLS